MTEAMVRVRVDTREAQQSERRMQRAKGRMQRVRDRAVSKLGLPTTRQAIGAAAGFRMLSRFRQTSVGNVDPWSEASIESDAFTQQLVNKALGGSVKASRLAREDAAQAFGFVKDEALRQTLSRDYFKVANGIRQKEEEGRLILRQTIVGPTMVELVKRAAAGYAKLLKASWDAIYGDLEAGK